MRIPKTLKCKYCKQLKETDELVKINDFIRKCCKKCYALDSMKSQREKDERFLQKRTIYELDYKRKYRAKHWDWALYKNAKQRAKRLNLEFTIEKSDIIVPEFCPVLGIKLQQALIRMNDNSPTLDRLNPSIGYTKENICVMSNRANRIKSNGTIDEHKKIIEFLERLDKK